MESEHFGKLQAVLSESRIEKNEKVTGKFRNYDAAFGVSGAPNRNDYYAYFQVRLPTPVKVPLFLWDVCPLDAEGTVCLRWGGQWVRWQYNGYLEEIEAEFQKESENSVREKFETMASMAGKIEHGEIDLQEIFSRQREEFTKQITIVIFIFAAVAGGVWIWMKMKGIL